MPSLWTVGEAIDFLRAEKELPDDFYNLFVVDETHKPVGSVPLSRAMRSPRPTRLTDIMETELRLVPADMDQEAVAYLFRQYALVSATVVDNAGRLIGVVTVDDVVRVIDEEAEEDLMNIVGASDTDFHAPPHIIAFNVWNGPGAPQAPAEHAGLRHFTIELPNADEMAKVAARLEAAKAPVRRHNDRIETADPSGNRIVLTAS